MILAKNSKAKRACRKCSNTYAASAFATRTGFICKWCKESPPRREWQGLTDTEIGMEYVKWDATPGTSMADFARAIEAALKEKNK
jgi:hypothetical protein